MGHHAKLDIQPLGVPCADHTLNLCLTAEFKKGGRLFEFNVALKGIVSKIKKMKNHFLYNKLKRCI